MTNWGFDGNDDELNGLGNDSELNGPKALRDAYAALKKQNDDLNAKLTSFLEDQQKSKVQTVFENLGIPDAANVYQGPADPKAAEEWAKSMKQLFGGNQTGTPVVADPEPVLNSDTQAQFQRMTEAGQQGVPLGNVEAAAGAVGDATDLKSLLAAMQNLRQ